MSAVRLCLFVAAIVGCSHPQTVAAPGSGQLPPPAGRQLAGPIAEHAGREALFEVVFDGASAFNTERPASFAVYAYQDGTVIYGVEPCGAPNGVRSRQAPAERISAMKSRLDRECDSIEDDGREQCEDAAALSIRCNGHHGSRRLNLTCQLAKRAPSEELVRESLGLLGLPAPFSGPSAACALARSDAQVASIDEIQETYPELYMVMTMRRR